MYTRVIASGFAVVLVIVSAASFGQPPANQDGIAGYAGHGPLRPAQGDRPRTSGPGGLPPRRSRAISAIRSSALYVFGNGGCSNDGASARLHLLNVASHGYLAIAPGGIHNGPSKTEAPPRPAGASIETYAPTRPAQLKAAIDWALAENGAAAAAISAASIPSRSRSPVSAVAAFRR